MRGARRVVVVLILGLAGGVFLFFRLFFSPATGDSRSSADPRLSYAGPHQNVRPDVAYVGDEACSVCHAKETATFREHPMGRSLFPLASVTERPPIDVAHHNPFTALGESHRIEQADGRTWHHQFQKSADDRTIYDVATEVKYAIGSGTHAQSYLWEQDGYVQQSPITWYAERRIWDASPGWLEVGGGRPAEGRCLFCHANRVEPMPGYANRFVAPVFRGSTIGCERCHGPGAKHVAVRMGDEAAGGDEEFTIVNPGKLPWRLRDAVCHQCHLEAETRIVKRGRELFDYRPGLPLEAFWTLVVQTDNDDIRRILSHPEQLERSRCFRASTDANKLGCISCHDPHVKPDANQRVAHFRQACLNCHVDHGCSLPAAERRRQNVEDSCFECHMPKRQTSDVPHVAGTDHRIPRRADQTITLPQTPPPALPDVIPVRLFHRQPGETLTAEERRDLGVALAELLTMNKVPTTLAGKTLELIDEALQTVPDDAAAWDAKASALQQLNRTDEALAAYREALRLEPNRESSVVGAGLLTLRAGRRDDALQFWKRALELNPWRPLHHGSLAILYAGRQQWRQAQEASEAWVRLEPANTEARRVLTLCWLRLGERPSATKEFAVMEALKPANLTSLQAWWNAETQGPAPGYRLPERPK
jgi:hypothetical protein